MQSPKATALELIQGLPDDSTLDDILRQLAFLRLSQEGLKRPLGGRSKSREELAKHLKPWLRRGDK